MDRNRNIPGEFKPGTELSSVYSGLVGLVGGARRGDGRKMWNLNYQ